MRACALEASAPHPRTWCRGAGGHLRASGACARYCRVQIAHDGDDGQQLCTIAVYEYIEEAIVVGIAPREGPQSGGTIARLALNTVDTSAVSRCRFGTIGPPSRAAGYGECASPARDGGPAMVSRVMSEVWDASEISFVYTRARV